MRQRAPFIAAAVGIGAVILVVVALVLPKLSAVHGAQQKVEAARSQQGTLQTKLAELKDTAARAAQYRSQLQVLQAEVPPTSDLPGLIRLLNDAADQSGVDFMSVAPGQPTLSSAASGSVGASSSPAPGSGASGSGSILPSPAPVSGAAPAAGPQLGVSVVPVTIIVNGSYFAVDEYLFRLETLPRASKVLSLSLQVGSTGLPQLQLSLTANFYTTDTSAGPGSAPGGEQPASAPVPGSAPTPIPGG
jgi:Tfp pilus assembly protein PilO